MSINLFFYGRRLSVNELVSETNARNWLATRRKFYTHTYIFFSRPKCPVCRSPPLSLPKSCFFPSNQCQVVSPMKGKRKDLVRQNPHAAIKQQRNVKDCTVSRLNGSLKWLCSTSGVIIYHQMSPFINVVFPVGTGGECCSNWRFPSFVTWAWPSINPCFL